MEITSGSIGPSGDFSPLPSVAIDLPHADAMAKHRHPTRRKRESRVYPFPPNVPLHNMEFDDGSNFTIPDDPLWRRKNRRYEPEVYPMRLRDIPVWAIEAIPFGTVQRKAESVANHPGRFEKLKHYPNYPRVVSSVKQELDHLLLNNKELLLKTVVKKIENFVEHRLVHTAAQIGSNFLLSVPLIGRIISSAMSFGRGAPEETVLNGAMLLSDLGFQTLAVAAAGAPILTVAVEAANILLNMYVNASARRRYAEVNNRIIPKMYDIMSFQRNPNAQDGRRAIYAKAFRQIEQKDPELVNKLAQEESDLNPKNIFNPNNERLRKKYAEHEDELVELGKALDALELLQYHDEVSQRWWQINKRINRWRRAGDIKQLQYFFDKIDNKMYEKYDFPHTEAKRMLDMWNIVRHYFPVQIH